jgi:small subunit ribosomal protein S18
MAMRRDRHEDRTPIEKPTRARPINYKDPELLARFIGSQGQIISRRRTALDTRGQRELKKAIKRARHLALLPFVA